jgi:hypothetical protein
VKTRFSVLVVAVFWVVAWSPGRGVASTQSNPEVPTTQAQSQTRSDAQNRSTPQRRTWWWKDPEIMKEIGISADLSKKIDALWHKRLPEAINQDRELKKHQTELDRLIKERKVGADVIAVQLDRLEAQRTTLNKSRTMMMYEIYQLLSAEQYSRLVAYNERRRNGRGSLTR